VTPVFVAARAKGRLDHALRGAGFEMNFSRKVAVRAIGDNTRRDVENYIARQIVKENFADDRFSRMMAEFTGNDEKVNLSKPTESARGRYWYNLHLVLVTDGRTRTTDSSTLRQIRNGCLAIAVKKGHQLARWSVMPDHLHLAVRPGIDEAPLEVVFCYQNNLAFLLGQKRIWCDGFYVGTFGEYTTRAVHDLTVRPDGE
jgi:REP element-mobilizing transposase RayT